jgi:hypothetical protein
VRELAAAGGGGGVDSVNAAGSSALRPVVADFGADLGAAGLGFYHWKAGARRTGTGTHAVLNNAKVPLGVAASLLLFGETEELGPLLLSVLALTAAVLLAERGREPAA